MNADEARAYLSSISAHRGQRSYDTAFMHPDLAIRLATSIQQARSEGIQAGLLSGVRQPTDHPSTYDLKGDSSHEYGLAGDVSGIGLAGSSTAQRWAQIAQANGLSSPYDPNGSEYNHWQIGPRLETAPQLLAALQTAKASGNPQAMWSAFDQNAGSAGSGPHPMTGGGADGGGDATAAALAGDMMQKYGLTRQQAIGAVGVMGYESGDFRTMQEQNPQGGRGGWGYAQWTGPRRVDFDNFVQQNRLDPASYAANWGMIQHEIATNPQYAAAITALKQESTVEGAARSWEHNYEGMTEGGPGVPAFEGHIARAVAYNSRLPQDLRAGGGGSTAPVAAPAPVSPWATLGSSLGEALGQMSNAQSASTMVSDPPDQPAIRSMAAQTDFMAPPANPVPQTLAGGIAPTLGSLAVQTPPLPSAVEDPGSITAGAPSMTAMLGGVGTATDPTLIDPRRTGSINPYTRPLTRLG